MQRAFTIDDDILEEQRAYYRARAPEYENWIHRRGRYDRGPEVTLNECRWRRRLQAAVP